MPPRDPQLPEGTDHIVNGAMATGDGAGAATAPRRRSAGTRGGKGFIGAKGASSGDGTGGTAGGTERRGAGVTKLINEQTTGLKKQAADRARQLAEDGKTRASDALDEVARAVGEAADIIDDRLGEQYGGYARRAAERVSGIATGLREREVDDLYEEARDFVRTSPVLTAGVAAAVGFALVRLVRAGMPDDEPTTRNRKTGA